MNVQKLIKNGESETVEFKTAFGKEVIISLVAFANTEGGKVVVGVDNAGKSTGLDIGPETEQRYLNEIKVSTYPQILPHTTLLELDGKHVLVFEINEYPIKPVSYKNRYYKRVKYSNHGYSIHIGRFKAADTIIDDLLIKSPLIVGLDETMVFIKKHINLSYAFDGSLKRKERWQYPMEALRELLLNAVVHRDYKNTSDIVIKIFDDRIVFTSPGRIYGDLTIEDLKRDDYVSSIRNKLLAEAFYLMGDIEKYGTGFVRIRQWLKDYPEISYEISEIGDFFRIVLECGGDMLGQVPDKCRTSAGQVPNKLNILAFCRTERSVKEMMTFFNMKHRETFMKNYIHQLIEEGILTMTIPDKPRSSKQRYVITPAGIKQLERLH